jgi:alpha-N-acetylglucosaminidase
MFAQLNVKASYALIKRVIPQHASSFVIESLQQQNGKDVFEIESRNNKIILRGNNGVAVASALYYYLTEFGHCQITWNGTKLTPAKATSCCKRKSPQTNSISISLLS